MTLRIPANCICTPLNNQLFLTRVISMFGHQIVRTARSTSGTAAGSCNEKLSIQNPHQLSLYRVMVQLFGGYRKSQRLIFRRALQCPTQVRPYQDDNADACRRVSSLEGTLSRPRRNHSATSPVCNAIETSIQTARASQSEIRISRIDRA